MIRPQTKRQNEFFEKEDETILDFTESNPFGDAENIMLDNNFTMKLSERWLSHLVLYLTT